MAVCNSDWKRRASNMFLSKAGIQVLDVSLQNDA